MILKLMDFAVVRSEETEHLILEHNVEYLEQMAKEEGFSR